MAQHGYDPIGEANERLRNALAQLKYARQVQKVFMDLGKGLSLRSSQEEILARIVEAVQSLFGEAYYLIQLTDPKTVLSTLVDYRGPLLPGAVGAIHLTRTSMAKTRLGPAVAQTGHVELFERPPNLFEDGQHAILVPLVADEQLYGVIHLEGHVQSPMGDDDEVLLISLANQLAMGLRNQRLLEETAYLKDYLADILEQANALIIVTDTNRQILVYNQAMERLLGFPKEQTLGTDLFLWVPTEEQERFAGEISATFNGLSSTVGVETRMRNRDGHPVQIIFHLSALRDRDGEIDSLILVGQDMTQIRELEVQVIEAEKMASLGKLAAGVVHELNNPLTSISVYAEYLLKKMRAGQADPGDISKMEKVQEGADRIQKLTRDLVSYGRPSSEEPEVLQLNELIAQGLSFCEHTIRKHEVVVRTDLIAELPPVLANRTQLLQLIINLITNACHAMDGGGELSLTTRTAATGQIQLTIADTGCGISEKDLKRVFEPFFTTKSAGQGTGLGLSIVSRIVEHHRGEIRVESTLGQGTTLNVLLPMHYGKPGREPPRRPDRSDPTPVLPRGEEPK
jgi:PAS domain S-box-containing protein